MSCLIEANRGKRAEQQLFARQFFQLQSMISKPSNFLCRLRFLFAEPLLNSVRYLCEDPATMNILQLYVMQMNNIEEERHGFQLLFSHC